jgi:hypothetical protein
VGHQGTRARSRGSGEAGQDGCGSTNAGGGAGAGNAGAGVREGHGGCTELKEEDGERRAQQCGHGWGAKADDVHAAVGEGVVWAWKAWQSRGAGKPMAAPVGIENRK